jgi:selenium-binding protein 1
VPELLLGQKYGHAIHFWDLAAGKHVQRVDLGAQHQMALEVRPSHDPEATWGFVGVVISTEDLSGSVWRWLRDGDEWKAEKVITIPAEPADPHLLPPALKPFAAVPPIITDIDLSVDDKFLYVSCWGTGEIKQFDVSDPANPKQMGSVRLGGIINRTRTRPGPTCRSPAGRRWSRSAATAGGSTSLPRCTGRGTTSSTRTASAPGWPSSTPTPTAG